MTINNCLMSFNDLPAPQPSTVEMAMGTLRRWLSRPRRLGVLVWPSPPVARGFSVDHASHTETSIKNALRDLYRVVHPDFYHHNARARVRWRDRGGFVFGMPCSAGKRPCGPVRS